MVKTFLMIVAYGCFDHVKERCCHDGEEIVSSDLVEQVCPEDLVRPHHFSCHGGHTIDLSVVRKLVWAS